MNNISCNWNTTLICLIKTFILFFMWTMKGLHYKDHNDRLSFCLGLGGGTHDLQVAKMTAHSVPSGGDEEVTNSKLCTSSLTMGVIWG